MKIKKLLQNRKAFTLMEVLVVLVIFGILAGIVIPNVLNNIGKGKRTSALEEEHNVVVAISVAMKQGIDGKVVEYSPAQIIPAKNDPTVPDNDPGKYLMNDTEFEWIITADGGLIAGGNNPLKAT